MITLTSFTFFLSTAEEERAVVVGPATAIAQHQTPSMPEGFYRVMDGELYRVVPGVPPNMPPPRVRETV